MSTPAMIPYVSPIGLLLLATRAERLCAVAFEETWPAERPRLERRLGGPLERAGHPPELTHLLDAYFAGDLAALERIEVEPFGTPFQDAVWRALRRVPAGATASYAAIARAIGRPTACRAVGAANGANPIPIVVPCHRVIGTDGTLTGYAGGLERKRWLLAHERAHAADRPGLRA